MTDASSVDFGGETVKGTVARLTMAATGFVGTIVFARVLGPTAFGGFYLLFALVKLADRPVNGWTTAAKKRYSEATSSKSEVVGSQITFSIVWAFVALIASIVVASQLRQYTGLPNAPILFALLILIVSLYESMDQLVQARGLLGAANWTDALRSYLTLPLQLALVFAGFGAAGMAYGLVGASLLTLPILWYFLQTMPKRPTAETLRSIWSFAKYSIPNKLVGKAYGRLDILLLGMLLTPATVGYYEVAAKLTLPGTFIGLVGGSGLMARTSNRRSKGEDDTVTEDVSHLLAFTSILSIPIFFGALVISRQLVVTVYGEKYTSAASLLIGIALYRVIQTQKRTLGATIRGLDRPDLNFVLAVIALAINVIIGILLTLRFGAIGVVIATVIAEIFQYIGAVYVIRREIPNVTLYPRPLIEQIMAGLVMFIGVYMLDQVIVDQSWITLSILIGAGATIYCLVLLTISDGLRVTVGSVFRGSRIEHLLPERILDW